MTARVLIDGHMLGSGETGNETYVRGLLGGLEQLGRRELVAVSGPGVDVGAHRPVVLSSRSDVARLTVGFVAAAREHGANVIHTTYAAPFTTSAASVVTVHDVSFLRHPEWFTLRDRAVLNAGVRASVKRAARVIVPSGHARDELCALLGVPQERVLVTPEGVDDRFAPVNGSRPRPADTDVLFRRLGIRRPYVLALGNLQPRKNLARLVEAWALLVSSGADAGHRLVVAGGFRGRRDGAPARAISLGIGDRVVLPRPHPRRGPADPVRRRERLRLPVAVRGLRPARAGGHGLRRAGRLLARRLTAGGRRRRRRPVRPSRPAGHRRRPSAR